MTPRVLIFLQSFTTSPPPPGPPAPASGAVRVRVQDAGEGSVVFPRSPDMQVPCVTTIAHSAGTLLCFLWLLGGLPLLEALLVAWEGL